MRSLCLVLVAVVAGLGSVQNVFAGKISGKTLSLEGEVLEGVRVDALAVSIGGVVDPRPINTSFSKLDGSYEIDVGDTARLILRFFRVDRNLTFLPNLPTATTGGAISGIKDVNDLVVLVPKLQSVTPCYPPSCAFNSMGGAFYQSGVPGANSSQATITVTLPANAKVTIGDQKMVSTGSTRRFTSPSLQLGAKYYYALKAEILVNGEIVSATRRVVVRAGEETRVGIDMQGRIIAAK